MYPVSSSPAARAATPHLEKSHLVDDEDDHAWETSSGGSRTGSISSYPAVSPHLIQAEAAFFSASLSDTASLTDSHEEKTAGKSKSLTSTQILTLISLCFTSVSSAMFYSLLAPFFPTEAHRKGASNTEVGFIMGIFQAIVFIAAPIYGNYLTQIGPKFMYVTGIMATSTCAILFGVLEWCPDGQVYVAMCFIVRAHEAIACAAVVTANLAIASYTFGERLSTVMGILQACGSVGLMVGPPLGGFLFGAGGFYLPFFVTGGAYMLCGIISIFILPSHKADPRPKKGDVAKGSRLVLLKIPAIHVVGYMVAMGSAAIGFSDVGLAPHFKPFNLSPTVIGLLFLIPSGSVIVLAPFIGWITDRNKKCAIPILVMGSFIGTVGFLGLGPSPVFSSVLPNESLTVVIVSLVIAGVGMSSLVVAYQQFVTAAKNNNFPQNMETQGIVSGVYNAFNSFGAFIGPTVGGIMIEKSGFDLASTIVGAGILLAGILLLVQHTVEICCKSSTSSEMVDRSPSESSPLIHSGAKSDSLCKKFTNCLC